MYPGNVLFDFENEVTVLQDREVQSARKAAAAEVDAAAVQAMQEHEARLTQMLEEAQSSLSSMQRLHRIANDKLFEMQSATEESAAGAASELDIASMELERAQQQCGPVHAICYVHRILSSSVYIMYLFTAVLHPHGHWQLVELLENQRYCYHHLRLACQ